MCPTPERLAGAPDVPQRNMGMIAEDMHEAGMTNLVGYDAYGRPDTIIRDDRIGTDAHPHHPASA